MKAMVVNYSGNVGKSTISRYLLSPRLNGARVIPVETINSDENETEAIKGSDFSLLFKSLMAMDSDDSIIIDVGASNVESLLSEMAKYDGSQWVLDYFVIPTVAGKKQQIDTLKTIGVLNEQMGVPKEKICVIFNGVTDPSSVPADFHGLFDYYELYQKFQLTPSAIIKENELYGLLRDTNKTIEEVLDDETDYRAAIAQSKDKGERMIFAQAIATKLLAMGVKKELDGVFTALFHQE